MEYFEPLSNLLHLKDLDLAIKVELAHFRRYETFSYPFGRNQTPLTYEEAWQSQRRPFETRRVAREHDTIYEESLLLAHQHAAELLRSICPSIRKGWW